MSDVVAAVLEGRRSFHNDMIIYDGDERKLPRITKSLTRLLGGFSGLFHVVRPSEVQRKRELIEGNSSSNNVVVDSIPGSFPHNLVLHSEILSPAAIAIGRPSRMTGLFSGAFWKLKSFVSHCHSPILILPDQALQKLGASDTVHFVVADDFADGGASAIRACTHFAQFLQDKQVHVFHLHSLNRGSIGEIISEEIRQMWDGNNSNEHSLLAPDAQELESKLARRGSELAKLVVRSGGMYKPLVSHLPIQEMIADFSDIADIVVLGRPRKFIRERDLSGTFSPGEVLFSQKPVLLAAG